MFSRAARSVVKPLTLCRIHSDGKNFKIARGISEILSKQSKNSTKLNALSLYDVAAVNKPLSNRNGIYNFNDNQLVGSIMKKSCSAESNQPNARKINDNINLNLSNHQEDNGRSQIKKLVEALYRLPIAEEVAALNSPLMPSEKIISKASNACSRMHPYARILNEMGHSSMKTWQRDYSTAVIRKWLPVLMYPPFHDVNFISQAKISKMYQSIEKREINNSSWNVPIAKENNHQMSPASLLNYNRKLAKGLMRKFSSSSLNFINHKGKNNHEIVASNSNSKRTTSGTLIITEEENWIQQIFFKIKSIFTDAHAKIRSYSTDTLDLYCSENEKIPVSDIISNNIILFGSKDCGSKANIRQKIQAFCAQHKKSLKKIGKDDICKKRERSCTTSEEKCQEKENMCGKKGKDCSKREKRTCGKQKVVSCKREKSSRDCHKTRKIKSQEDPCKQKKNDTCGTKKDLYKRQHCMKQTSKRQEKDLCKKEKKEEIKKSDCLEIKKAKPCEKEEKNYISRKIEDLFKNEHYMEQERIFNDVQEKDVCKKEKKEEIKKPDCSEIKKVEPCDKKKECPPVKKAPGCSEDEKTKKSC